MNRAKPSSAASDTPYGFQAATQHASAPSAGPASRPPLQPLTPINLLSKDGYPVRNDNLTNFAYVGPNDGKTDPPEVYIAVRPGNPTDPTPIQPGETAQLQSTQTGKYCRLAQLPAGFVTPATCNTQGILCDQDSLATATILTYTGNGLSFNGVPLVVLPPSMTLVLSADPTCTVPGSDKLDFPTASLSEWQRGGDAVQCSAVQRSGVQRSAVQIHVDIICSWKPQPWPPAHARFLRQ